MGIICPYFPGEKKIMKINIFPKGTELESSGNSNALTQILVYLIPKLQSFYNVLLPIRQSVNKENVHML